ncbi:hypothetical protein Tco_1471363 [Tanacetum coccineum]
MSDKSSPFKMSSFGKLFDLDFSKEKSVFTPATDSRASNPTPIDCMERGVKPYTDTEKGSLENIEFPRWVDAKVVSSEVKSEEWRRLLLR